jgi:peptidoglycan-associated lipoprotein
MNRKYLSFRTGQPLAILGACLACASPALGAGCAKHETSLPAKAPVPAAVAEQPLAPRTTTTSSASIHVGDDLAKACHMDFGSVDRAPKFDFDRSMLLPDDRSVLDQVAKCVTTGPLKGRRLQLIGRADPRGEVEYNMVLGESRADSVLEYLTALGVSKSIVTESSRGKLDATGTDEDGWRRDRRVDVDLL